MAIPQIPMYGAMNVNPPGYPVPGTTDIMIPGGLQRIWYPLYSRFAVAATTINAQYFNVQPAVALDGNFQQANTLPDPELFELWGIGWLADPAIPEADLQLLLQLGTIHLTVNQKPVYDSLLVLNPAGGGITGPIPALGAGDVSNGVATPQAVHWWPIPFFLLSKQTFAVFATFDAPGLGALTATVNTWAILYGIRHRTPIS